MREMGWSWTALEETPLYVRRYCIDIMSIRRRVEAERVNRNRGPG